MQIDNQGDAGRRAAGRSHTGARRILACGALAAIILAALGAASSGASTSGAQAAAPQAARTWHHPPDRSPALLVTSAAPPPTPTPAAPGTPVTGGAEQSDPFLTDAGGRYLLLTSGGTGRSPVNVPVATSSDFVHWTHAVDALPTLPVWAKSGFTWAPDLHRFGTRYALYFTAMVAGHLPQTQCIGSAFALSPTGPFVARPRPIICQLDQGGSIDPRVFVDSGGISWMQWKSDQNRGGAATPTAMWSQRLSSDGSRLLARPVLLMHPDQPWQGTIVEAPDMVEVDGTYWVIYSANWFNQPAYAIGAAHCAGPAGPCRDLGPAPLLSTNFQGDGPGEASVFHDANGVWLLYTPRRSLAPKPDIPARPVYITRLGFTPSGPYLASGPPPGAGNLTAVPFWSPTS